MSIASVVRRGYGNTIPLVVTRGYTIRQPRGPAFDMYVRQSYTLNGIQTAARAFSMYVRQTLNLTGYIP